jgi:hypothetical protein
MIRVTVVGKNDSEECEVTMFGRLKPRRIKTTCSTYTKGQNCTEFQLLITPMNRFHLGDLDVDGAKKTDDFAKKNANGRTDRI